MVKPYPLEEESESRQKRMWPTQAMMCKVIIELKKYLISFFFKWGSVKYLWAVSVFSAADSDQSAHFVGDSDSAIFLMLNNSNLKHFTVVWANSILWIFTRITVQFWTTQWTYCPGESVNNCLVQKQCMITHSVNIVYIAPSLAAMKFSLNSSKNLLLWLPHSV